MAHETGNETKVQTDREHVTIIVFIYLIPWQKWTSTGTGKQQKCRMIKQ